MVTLTLAVLGVLLGSALCSASEIALLTVAPVRAQQLAAAGGRRARALLTVRGNVARPIVAIVIVNNVCNIGGSIAVGMLATQHFGERSVGVVSAALTFLIVLFAEIAPKTFAERHAERVALAVALPVKAGTTLLLPMVVLFETLMRPMTGGDRGPTTNEDEIQLLAGIGHQEGVIEQDELEMLRQVFELNDHLAEQLMTPRTAVTWLDASRSLTEATADILASEHSRIVVADGGLDAVVGVALKHELLAGLLSDPGRTVGSFAREVVAVPGLVRADDLLRTFRQSRRHLAVVVDEWGGTAGVVTLEDVVEVLTGPVVDETDRRPDLRSHARMHPPQAR